MDRMTEAMNAGEDYLMMLKDGESLAHLSQGKIQTSVYLGISGKISDKIK